LLPMGLHALEQMLRQITEPIDDQIHQLERNLGKARERFDSHSVRVRELMSRIDDARSSAEAARDLRRAIEREIMNSAVSWMAYLMVPVTIGEPFHYRASELLPLYAPRWSVRQWRRLHTRQIYHFNPLDAQGVHLEVSVDDPVLKVATKRTLVSLGPELNLNASPLQTTFQRAKSKIPFRSRAWRKPEHIFAQEYAESERIVHFYSTRRTNQLPYRGRTASVRISFQYNLLATTKISYLAAILFVVGAVSYAAYEWRSGTPAPARRTEIVTIGLAFLAIVVAFMGGSERRPITRGKLEAFRLLFYAALLALTALILIWGFSGPEPTEAPRADSPSLILLRAR
jgi:hypothetical protein